MFGGKSAEHEISLRSARSIVEAIDQNKYEIVLLGIDKKGRWLSPEDSELLLQQKFGAENKSKKESYTTAFVPEGGGRIICFNNERSFDFTVDVVFPVLHGPFGEDGTFQGLLKTANVPFVGSDVLGSAIGMDKDIMKKLLRDSGISVGKFLTLRVEDKKPASQEVFSYLGRPVFIKPANMGSSVGVSRVDNQEEYELALEEAFWYDNKVLIEERVEGREIECSVLGNQHPTASLPGEVVPKNDFYSYKAKYIDEDGATLIVPADLSKDLAQQIQAVAIQTFKTLCCDGLGRVDMFLKADGRIVVNEINTMPGFTSISMYPKLWKASGLSYAELVDSLIGMAFEKFEQVKKLKSSYAHGD